MQINSPWVRMIDHQQLSELCKTQRYSSTSIIVKQH